MAKTKEDYAELGRLCVQKEDGPEGFPAPYPRSSTSWQARAFWEAYLDEAERVSESLAGEGVQAIIDGNLEKMADATGLSKEELMGETRPIKISAVVKVSTNLKPTGVKGPAFAVGDHYVHADTRAWPGAAAEHFRMLKASLYKEKSPGRQARLKSALTRLILRHAPPYP